MARPVQLVCNNVYFCSLLDFAFHTDEVWIRVLLPSYADLKDTKGFEYPCEGKGVGEKGNDHEDVDSYENIKDYLVDDNLSHVWEILAIRLDFVCNKMINEVKNIFYELKEQRTVIKFNECEVHLNSIDKYTNAKVALNSY